MRSVQKEQKGFVQALSQADGRETRRGTSSTPSEQCPVCAALLLLCFPLGFGICLRCIWEELKGTSASRG